MSLSWASEPGLTPEIPMNSNGLESYAVFKTQKFYLAHAGFSRYLELQILAQVVSGRITHTLRGYDTKNK